jgi:DNA phosphorothioation-associated putative methyltransferase
MATISIPDWPRYKQLIQSLPYGKVLPSAIYLHRETDACRDGDLGKMLLELAERHAIGDEFNVVKFRLDAPRLSFLFYPGFFEEPHPPLEVAVAIDLVSGRAFSTSYRDTLNSPILHRKELLLPPTHPRVPEFAALSKAEEQAGLYSNSAVIGFRINWERLLAARRLAFEGHSLLCLAPVLDDSATQASCAAPITVDRHKTALTRYDLSKPVRSLLEHGQLLPGSRFLDYGCGLGTDVRAIRELGFEAAGWDPIYAPEAVRTEADVVNLGYVLNVIEDPGERLDTLAFAWRLAKRLLVVSALIGDPAVTAPQATRFSDGVLTRRNTFQKYFAQQELQRYIEDALEASAVPAALGIFYIFRNPEEHQAFLQSRSRRTFEWNSLRPGLQRRERASREPQPRRPVRVDGFAQQWPLLEEFWSVALSLARIPLQQEFLRYTELCGVFGSAKRALRRAIRGREEVFARAQAARQSDLLVYLASANLRKTIPFLHLPEAVRTDIAVFFGSYKRGLAQGRALLYSAADTSTIMLACDEAAVGWQDTRSLYVPTSMSDRLPTVLRTLVSCAELLFGDMREADILRIHKMSGKVTFLSYTGFHSALLPELAVRTRVNLRRVQVEVFEHAGEGQLLYFKERFLDPEDSQRDQLLRVSETLKDIGLQDSPFSGPRATDLRRMLAAAGHVELIDELCLTREGAT